MVDLDRFLNLGLSIQYVRAGQRQHRVTICRLPTRGSESSLVVAAASLEDLHKELLAIPDSVLSEIGRPWECPSQLVTYIESKLEDWESFGA